MWYAIAAVLVTAICIGLLMKSRRRRLRDRRMILGEMRDVVRLLDDPVRAGEVSFTGPYRSDDDRSHDTMFGARHGHRLLSFILDTSGMRIRWWVLYELYAPETGERTLRMETTLVGSDIPPDLIRLLLQAARGKDSKASTPASETAPERRVDPFESVPTDPAPPAAQA